MSQLQNHEFSEGVTMLDFASPIIAPHGDGGDTSFMNNVPDPVTAGPELPTFKFALDKSTGKVIGNCYGKEATVTQLPISKGLAGVSMQLEPGAMRELHWHATAAEWAFVLEGQVRTTVIAPDGTSETNDFEPGDVWYFPRGHGHVLECLGNKPCHFILIFDNGYFSEFGTFSITDWLGHTPKALLAKNFGLPESAFEGLPQEEVYFAQGEVPPTEQTVPLQGWKKPKLTHKYAMMKQPPHRVFAGGREWTVDSTSFPISTTISGVILELEPGALRELHWHPTADEWHYVITGNISVTMFGSHGRYRTETLEQGDVGYIPQRLWPLHRKRRQHPLPHSDWVQHRHLSDHRSDSVDRRQPYRHLGDKLFEAGLAVR
ncbi:Oxalate decarboxylase OxdD [Anatilimnocola aggregata]|uniref:Oxalate decarboxylase OxdD n=1 Tax=Anatilimnocola aggregata TaxID=2528021 RepID=A0A517Y7G3_9BACT|nr:cupin domain-containing protein [Anatilimnocola aggregata]QDU26169.1 Oxalate decarboxylase OxdD [Anatilimnocola aggregata]